MSGDGDRIELTLRLWGTGDRRALDSYVEHLRSMLPRHDGVLERQVAEIPAGPGQADIVLILSFPNGAAVDGFLRDPLRREADSEDLAQRAVSRALITDARHHPPPGEEDADVVDIRAADPEPDP